MENFVGRFEFPRFSLWIRTWRSENVTPKNPSCAGKTRREKQTFPHYYSNSGHPITPKAATANRHQLVAFYDMLGGRPQSPARNKARAQIAVLLDKAFHIIYLCLVASNTQQI